VQADAATTEANPVSEREPVEAVHAGDCTAAVLLGQLWRTLGDILGPATTATLLRRSIKYAAVDHPTLSGVEITREGFEYRYSLPAAWSGPSSEALTALRGVVQELWRLLIPLTDGVVVRRLEQLPDFQRCGLIPPQEKK